MRKSKARANDHRNDPQKQDGVSKDRRVSVILSRLNSDKIGLEKKKAHDQTNNMPMINH